MDCPICPRVLSRLLRIASVHRPNTGRTYFEEKKEDLLNKYTQIDTADAGERAQLALVHVCTVHTSSCVCNWLCTAEKCWRYDYKRTKDGCIHGASCKNPEVCKSELQYTVRKPMALDPHLMHCPHYLLRLIFTLKLSQVTTLGYSIVLIPESSSNTYCMYC